MVEQVYGMAIWSPTDFDRLSAQILDVTNQRLGVSTLKRMWGYVKSEHVPTFNTLSILSRFVGFRDWDSFTQYVNGETDSEFSEESQIVGARESLGTELIIEWEVGKSCRLKKILNPARFEVVDSSNVKLKPGDTLTLNSVSKGKRFIALECKRGDRDLGNYVGAIRTGVTGIIRKENE